MHRHFRSIPPAIGGIGISLPYSADTLRIDIALGILPSLLQHHADLSAIDAFHLHGTAEARLLYALSAVLTLLEIIVVYQ